MQDETKRADLPTTPEFFTAYQERCIDRTLTDVGKKPMQRPRLRGGTLVQDRALRLDFLWGAYAHGSDHRKGRAPTL